MNIIEESTELVQSMEDNRAFDYGATDHCKGASKMVEETPATASRGRSYSVNMNSDNGKLMQSDEPNDVTSSKKPCLCIQNDGKCHCGVKRQGIRLEPWHPMKSFALFSVLAMFALWIVVISSLGAKNKL